MAARSSPRDLAFELRCQLAVRSWVSPGDLLTEDLASKKVKEALNQVAAEVETSFSDYPGKWYLGTDARRRVLGLVEDSLLAEIVGSDSLDGDAEDSLLAAFRYTLGVEQQPMAETLSDEVLRALPLVAGWLGKPSEAPIDPETTSALLQRRAHQRDITKMTKYPLVGKIHHRVLNELAMRFAALTASGISINYLHGLGGSGKSTLLAFLEQNLARSGHNCAVVRMDFDDPLVDPLDAASLDLALIAGLSQIDVGNAHFYAQLSEQLRMLRLAQSDQPTASSSATRQTAKIRQEYSQSSDSATLESVSSETTTGRESALFGLLGRTLPGRPLVLIVDTAELAIARGETAVIELCYWISSLVSNHEATEVRVALAGRDPPEAANGLIERLTSVGRIDEIYELPELTVEEGAELLRNYGVADMKVALAAAKAVPRNPLLLRHTAEALTGEPDLVKDVRAAHRDEQVDLRTARKYLSRRILAHLAAREARPYLLAAMLLPVVTRAQLRSIVLPQVDGNAEPNIAKADRVFRGLASARWLTRPSADGRTISFHPDIRSLVLDLLRADPDEADREAALRHAAISFHDARSTPRDRAFAFYHRAKLGEDLRPPRNPARVAEELRPLLDELPEAARAMLLARRGEADGRERFAAPPAAAPSESDDDWRRRLEGDGKMEGEGDRLLKRDRPLDALLLYRNRPTRPPGTPPTFVLRALTDLAQWNTGEVEVDAILDESKEWFQGKRLSGAAMSRMYWITRFALVRDSAKLSSRHIAILETTCEHIAGASLTTMPAIVAVAEAGAGRPIMPERMRSGRGRIESETRVHLVHALQSKRSVELKPHLDALIVTQRDWAARLRKLPRSKIDPAFLDAAQRGVQSLDRHPISALSPMLRSFRMPLPIHWNGEHREDGILLLRGMTGEFLRPLRQVLVDLLGNSKTHDRAFWVIGRSISDMSILPLELFLDELKVRLERDAAAWTASFVGFADRCRLLPLLCNELLAIDPALPSVDVAHHVARSFLAWDHAICGGLTSNWSPMTARK